MLALCLLVYKCLLNEKRLSGVFLPVLRPLPPRVTGFSLVAAGRTKGLETRARLPMPGSAPQLSGCSMESSFLPYLMAVMWMSFLLLLSVWLRAKVTFLQKYLVPAGIIAGTLGFALINLGWIGYPSPEGWVPLKVGDFGMISFHLFSFGFGIIGLGCFSTHTKGRSMTLIKGALWIDLLFWLFYGLQATVGYGITELYAKITGSDLTAATGFLAGFGFAFGPGQALSVGMSWQNDYGLPDCVSMGLAYAAAGFMVANFVGVPLANWGLRKGYATYGTKELSSDFLKGLRPEDKPRLPVDDPQRQRGYVRAALRRRRHRVRAGLDRLLRAQVFRPSAELSDGLFRVHLPLCAVRGHDRPPRHQPHRRECLLQR